MVVLAYLRRRGLIYSFDWRHNLPLFLSCGGSALIGYLIMLSGANIFVAAGIVVLMYPSLIFFTLPLKAEEKATMLEIVPEKIRRRLPQQAS